MFKILIVLLLIRTLTSSCTAHSFILNNLQRVRYAESFINVKSMIDYEALSTELYAKFNMTDISQVVVTDEERKSAAKYDIQMDENEAGYLLQQLRKSSSYFEFGSGKSTMMACESNPELQLHTVESDMSWHAALRAANDCLRMGSASDAGLLSNNNVSRVHFYYVDIGETEAWGYPVTRSYEDTLRYDAYSSVMTSSVFKAFPADIDLVLIDGRFRVACVLQVLINTHKSTSILVHDFVGRDSYAPVLLFADVIKRAGETLVVLRRKVDLRPSDVLLMREMYSALAAIAF